MLAFGGGTERITVPKMYDCASAAIYIEGEGLAEMSSLDIQYGW